MVEPSPIRWAAVRDYCRRGLLPTLVLEHVPRVRWTERDEDGRTLLHYACRGPNVALVVQLLCTGLDVNALGFHDWTPAHVATWNGQARVLAMLCAAGAHLTGPRTREGSALDMALAHARRGLRGADACARVLVANGVRLSSARRPELVSAALHALERGVLRCRAVAVALLGIKRRRRPDLRHVDKFLMRELALDIWRTRAEEAWA